jgi:uncharacterized membrane protein (DUF4010 family)
MVNLDDTKKSIDLGNPFTIGPALKFGAILAVIIFATKASTVIFGAESLMLTSCLGGLMDVDAIAVTVGDLFHDQEINSWLAVTSILLAMLMNAIFKTGVAFTTGTKPFGIKVASSFALMFIVAWVVYFVRSN